jgi:DegV family protein with EDD domain
MYNKMIFVPLCFSFSSGNVRKDWIMVKIVADTLSVIPTDEAARLGIAYLPQIIIFGDESYRDDTEMDTPLFLKKLRASPVLPKTAAPPPELYHPVYKEAIEAGESVIVVCPSTILSGTYRGAFVAAQEYPDADIRVIDTHLIAGALGSVVLHAKKWADEGLDADTIVANITDMAARNRTYFMVPTLEYLHKGGRIGGAAALFGSILQVKPILECKDGRIEAAENQRTKKKAIARLEELIRTDCENNLEADLTVMECDAPLDAQGLVNDIKSTTHIKEIPIYGLPPAIVVHAGPGVMAVSYFLGK